MAFKKGKEKKNLISYFCVKKKSMYTVAEFCVLKYDKGKKISN